MYLGTTSIHKACNWLTRLCCNSWENVYKKKGKSLPPGISQAALLLAVTVAQCDAQCMRILGEVEEGSETQMNTLALCPCFGKTY